MKWHSFKSLWEESKHVFFRFPLQVIVSIFAVVVCFLLIDHEDRPELVRLLITANFFLTLSLSADLFSESRRLNQAKQWALRVLVLLFCGLMYSVLNPAIYQADIYRVALLAFAFHLAVAFVPFLYQGNLNGFWTYNKILFLRILTSGLYAGVLFIGLAIALASLHELFNINIGSNWYLRLFCVVSVGFATFFFLAGVPRDLKVLSVNEHLYPKGLKIFTQYVLIPLLSIYLAILLVYEGKIAVDWEFPKGMVSILVLGYAVLGILSLLLIYPIRGKEGNSWMHFFSSFFYLMMVPLVVLLLLAVWTRISAYGITEPRYILIILALWLSILTLYFLFSKRGNIKFIPISLCVLALLSTYGPQSAFSVSKFSQVRRLRQLVALRDHADGDQKREVIRYLVKNHGLKSLQEFTGRDLSEIQSRVENKGVAFKYRRYRIESDLVDTAFKVMKVKSISDVLASEVVAFSSEEPYAVKVSGYDYVIPNFDSHASSATYTIDGQQVVIRKLAGLKFTVQFGVADPVVFDVAPLTQLIKAEYNVGSLKKDSLSQNFRLPDHSTGLQRNLGVYDGSFILTQATLDVTRKQASDKTESFSGTLLLKLKAR
jgi:hypothetical protein